MAENTQSRPLQIGDQVVTEWGIFGTIRYFSGDRSKAYVKDDTFGVFRELAVEDLSRVEKPVDEQARET